MSSFPLYSMKSLASSLAFYFHFTVALIGSQGNIQKDLVSETGCKHIHYDYENNRSTIALAHQDKQRLNKAGQTLIDRLEEHIGHRVDAKISNYFRPVE